MSYSHAERLTALDTTFLDIETPSVHMHVGSVGVFEGGPLTGADGALDWPRVRRLSGPALRRSPRFRQKLVRTPLLGRPAWVDDPRFNLDYHLRHTSLPEPGDERQLKRLAGRIMSQKLDRHKPLWEMWFVEGLEGGRFAVITKVHHCMIDGMSGADLLAGFMRAGPSEAEEEATEERWLPRPAPGGARLLAGELWRRAVLPAQALGALPRAATRPTAVLAGGARAALGVAEAVVAGLRPASPTPLNQPIGPHRRFDWTRFDLDVVREVKEKLGATLNDVVLSVVAGALREFLLGRGVEVDELDFRVFVPVSTRRRDERGKLGNRVAYLLVRLPVEEPDPGRRVRRVVGETRARKESHQVEGGETLEALADLTGSGLLAQFSRLGAAARSYNMVVTNVPGPPFRVELAGCPMVATYPLVPLFSNQGLGIALFSYAEGLFWGFNADWDAVPDLHDLVSDVEREFEILRKL